jgi:hypothetical protein
MPKRSLRIGLPDGQGLIETLPDDQREFELRCGRGLARYLSARLGVEIRTEVIEHDEKRGDVRLVGPASHIEVQIVEPAINKMHEWSSLAVQAQRILDHHDTAGLTGLVVHFEDPQPPKKVTQHLPAYLAEVARLRPGNGNIVVIFRGGPLGMVWCRAAKDPASDFKAWFWPRMVDGPGISSAIGRKLRDKKYPDGTCLLVATTLDPLPGGDVTVPDLDTNTVEFVDDLELARRHLASRAHPFRVVWRSVLMPWSYEGGDSICVLHGDEAGLFTRSPPERET